MFVPRSISKRPKHTHPRLVAHPTPTLSLQEPLAYSSERISLVHRLIKEALSDWALSTHHRNLLDRIPHDGYIHPSFFVLLPSFEQHSVTQDEISHVVQRNESSFRRKPDSVYFTRVPPIEIDTIRSYDDAFWAKRIFYVENIPPAYSRNLEEFLSEVLSTDIIHSRFPLLYTDPKPEVLESSLNSVELLDPEQLGNPKLLRLPPGNGSFKGFAMIVVQDVIDWERWSLSRSFAKHFSHTGKNAKVAEAEAYGFGLLPISEWNLLKISYIAYQKRLLDDKEKEKEIATSKIPIYTREPISNKHITAGDNWTKKQKVTTASSNKNEEEAYPLNRVIFIKNINISTRKLDIRNMLLSLLPKSTETQNIIEYVDLKSNLDYCHVRFSSHVFTKVIYDHFQQNKLIQDYESLEKLVPVPQNVSSISVEILKGERERLYWQDVPTKKAPKSQQKQQQKQQNETYQRQQNSSPKFVSVIFNNDLSNDDKQKSSHIRFDDN